MNYSAIYVQQQCNNAEMPLQSGEPDLQVWVRGLSSADLMVSQPQGFFSVFFRHLLEQLLKIRAVAQRIKVGVGLANLETGKAACNSAVESAHGACAINLAAQAISGAKLGLVVRRGRGWASTNQRNAKRKVDRKLVIVRGIKLGKTFEQIHRTLERAQGLGESFDSGRAAGR